MEAQRSDPAVNNLLHAADHMGGANHFIIEVAAMQANLAIA